MELNVSVTPRVFKKTKAKKSEQPNKRGRGQLDQNAFSFTFNNKDKVSATVAKIKQPGNKFKTVKNTTVVTKDDSVKPNQTKEGIVKKKVVKFLPNVKDSYGPASTGKVTESVEKLSNVSKKPVKQMTQVKPQKQISSKNDSVSDDINEKTPEIPKPIEKSSTDYKFGNKGKPMNPQSKISSLFGNNPEVPTIGQRLVKPVTENVFCGKPLTSLNLHPHAVKNLKDLLNITELTTVQEKTIPVILDGRDALVRSQTGSGKTLAYGLPIVQTLQDIRPKINRNQGVLALIVVPTRELAIQTYELFVKLLKPYTWIVPGYLMGGEKRKSEKARLRKGINILIGTPGRLCDHLINSAHLKLNSVKYLILDEADRLLELGYERDVKEIVHSLSKQKETAWYDPMEQMRKAIEKNVETGKSVQGNRKVFAGSDEENDEDNEENDDENEESDDENEESDDENDEDEDENDEDEDENDDEDDENDDDEDDEDEEDSVADSDESEDDDGKVKKHRGITMFQGTKSTELTSPTIKTIQGKEESEEECNTEDVPKPAAKTKDTMQTVLLSATLTPAVESLAGLALQNPIFIETSEDKTGKISQSGEFSGAVKNAVNDEMMSIPSSIAQTYIVVPPKLRLVTLSGLIIGECRKKQNAKILVFVATQHLVDFHCELMMRVLGDSGKDDDSDDDDFDEGVKLAGHVRFFKLHGTMSQQERTKVFKEFRAVKAGVLFCTDVAARGLDVPSVGLVVQYTPPVGAADYAHRVGRTARGGRAGKAALMLSPHETQYVRELEDRRVRLKQEPLESSLESLLSPRGPCSTTQAAATALQQRYEEAVVNDGELKQMACRAFSSWARFYAAFPREWKPIFNVKLAHTGHYAKSMALREAPGNKNMRRVAGAPEVKEKPKNRLTRERDPEEEKKEKRRASGGEHAVRGMKGAQKRAISQKERQRQLVLSEFDGGMPIAKKPRKN